MGMTRALAIASLALVGCPGRDVVVSDGASADAVFDVDENDASADAIDAADAATPVEVTIATGRVIGNQRGNEAAFFGIPFAEPPIGALRWRPPVARHAWSTPFDARALGNVCPQANVPATPDAARPRSEDCLSVNVWTPDLHPVAALPVMVYVHGGNFDTGDNGEPLYDGRSLATDGNVVVVSINYRLGPLGFFAHALLDAEDTVHHVSGNYGFLDQILALEWVRDNARAFGGDPSNVTLFGESAGAMSVCGHLASPRSRGLFRRAILESGTCSILGGTLRDGPDAPYESAESFGSRYVASLHCDTQPDPIACMRAVSAADLMTAIPTTSDFQMHMARFYPVIDGVVFPESPWLAATASPPRIADVPIVLGSNHDEANLFVIRMLVSNEADYRAAADALFGAHAADAIAAYPLADFDAPKTAVSQMMTDLVFACPTRALARSLASAGRRVWLYEFAGIPPLARTFNLGSAHGMELPYVFGIRDGTFALHSSDLPLSIAIQGYWTRFADTGDPQASDSVPWPRYDAGTDAWLSLETNIHAASGDGAHRCAAIRDWLAPI
jgi:para-nitrobenzyl esterase